MNGKKIVILGGGVGGIVAANELRRLLPQKHRITVIERNAIHAFAPSFLWVMSGTRRSTQVQQPIASLLRTVVEMIVAEATNIDLARCVVETDRQSVEYDFLIIAVGAELAPEMIPGLSEASHTFYSLRGAKSLQEVLPRFSSGRVAIVVCSLPYKCPGAPLEGAMLIADRLAKRQQKTQFEVSLYSPEPQPMPVAGPTLGQAAVEMLTSRGIKYYPLHRLLAVDHQAHHMQFEGKGPVPYDLLVAIPPHQSPAIVARTALAKEAGWIPVDRTSLKTKVDNVFAIGDVTSISIPGRWKPEIALSLPKAGVFAHSQALVAAHRIAGTISGQMSSDEFCGDGYCMLEAGEDLAGFAYGNFFAEPSPDVRLKRIGRTWHLGKVLFEKMWLSPPGARKAMYQACLEMGAKLYGVPTSIH